MKREIKRACDIAAGRRDPDPNAKPALVWATLRHYYPSYQEYRIVWRHLRWKYLSRGSRFEQITQYAAAFPGEVLIHHPRTGQIQPRGALVVSATQLAPVLVAGISNEQLMITLPDGTRLRYPDPRN